jgi:4-hydroxy-tetrahydrodipicolinate reductase
MKLALIGYGKMGRMLEQLAPEYGFQVAMILDVHNNACAVGITKENFAGIDAAIEFSTPEAAVDNAERLAGIGVPVVIGTTGWLHDIPRVRAAVLAANSAAVWSPNYSVGVNVFFRVVAEAAKLMAAQSEYGAWAWEIHHDTKKDAPSGTLLKLVDGMKSAGYSREIDISSNRAGRVPGTHEIGFDGAADTITLRHTARSRESFARGALQAAKWVVGKQGFFEFSETLF